MSSPKLHNAALKGCFPHYSLLMWDIFFQISRKEFGTFGSSSVCGSPVDGSLGRRCPPALHAAVSLPIHCSHRVATKGTVARVDGTHTYFRGMQSWWTWSEQRRDPGSPRVVSFFSSPCAHLVWILHGGCAPLSPHQALAEDARKVHLQVCARVRACVRAWIRAHVCTVCLPNRVTPQRAVLKGRQESWVNEYAARRMQQLMCASCTVGVRGGWWLWSARRTDRMFCSFKPPSSVR